MPLPCPAPAWMSTLWPARVSSSTPTGIIATRYSSALISFGTPTTWLMGFVSGVKERKGGRSVRGRIRDGTGRGKRRESSTKGTKLTKENGREETGIKRG